MSFASILFFFFVSSALAQPASRNAPADRSSKLSQLVDELVSRNAAPQIAGDERFGYPVFAEKFDWKDQKRVSSAAFALAQDDSNDLWGCLLEHFHDKRYSATCRIDECYPANYEVGSICFLIARDKLQCAYLKHLEPGKTSHYGGPTFNNVSENSQKYLPDSLQRTLHYSPIFYESESLTKWYQSRKGKLFFELQIQACQWAEKKVADDLSASDTAKNDFISAIRKEVETIKKSKTPVVDRSAWASPMSEEASWRFYSLVDAQADRDTVVRTAQNRKPGLEKAGGDVTNIGRDEADKTQGK